MIEITKNVVNKNNYQKNNAKNLVVKFTHQKQKK